MLQTDMADMIVDEIANSARTERALTEGLNSNTKIANIGSLIGISVMVKCFRCAKLLIEFEAKVDEPIEHSQSLLNAHTRE